MDAYIGVRGGTNSSELSDVPADRSGDYARYYWKPVHGEVRVPKTKWVVLRYPSPAMAQLADMSTEAFEDYYFRVCCLDYGKMDRAMDALKERMERADRVRLGSPGTDLSFSIRGLPAIKCAGKMNIPDGEVYTAPVRDSVNGVITYNPPSVKDGFTFSGIRLTFRNGKIVDAAANDTGRINAQLDIDEGARYVGEFAIGVNPYITFPMKDTLFDEKIAGSIHFTPGASYDDCFNGNRSSLHWDLVLIQTPEYGGGELWFDDTLIRRDGRFVPEDLQCLNPENLI
jgi:aminopeptidase